LDSKTLLSAFSGVFSSTVFIRHRKSSTNFRWRNFRWWGVPTASGGGVHTEPAGVKSATVWLRTPTLDTREGARHRLPDQLRSDGANKCRTRRPKTLANLWTGQAQMD